MLKNIDLAIINIKERIKKQFNKLIVLFILVYFSIQIL